MNFHKKNMQIWARNIILSHHMMPCKSKKVLKQRFASLNRSENVKYITRQLIYTYNAAYTYKTNYESRLSTLTKYFIEKSCIS
jgi:hypothetical protein